jgi:hypothetical protein
MNVRASSVNEPVVIVIARRHEVADVCEMLLEAAKWLDAAGMPLWRHVQVSALRPDLLARARWRRQRLRPPTGRAKEVRWSRGIHGDARLGYGARPFAGALPSGQEFECARHERRV